jgi:hypothetical protein
VMSRRPRPRAALRTLWLQENKGELHGVP